MSDLPSNWTLVRLAEVCAVIRGITFPASVKQPKKLDANVCCLRTTNIQHEIDWSDVYFVPRDYVKRSEQLVRSGDVLMSMANSYELVGKVAIAKDVPFETAFGAFLSAVRPTPAINGQLLFHFLRTPYAQRSLREGSSQTTNIANISVGRLGDISVSLPPLPEQQRIASKLNALLTRVDACRDRLARVPAILKQLRQAIYQAAATGALTEDWRAERATSLEKWSNTTVDAVATLIFDGPFGSHLKSADYTDTGVRVVRLENIAPLRFIEDKRTYIAEGKFETLARHTLLADDVLFSSFVDEEVRVCLLPLELSGKAINKADCFCIRVDRKRCDPQFLALRLASRSTFSALDEVIHGVTRPRINLGHLRAIAIRLPTPAEQVEIIRRVKSLLALASTIEARLKTISTQVDRLTPALLAKAFRGELVPQDPDDGSAADLLAEVRRDEPGDQSGRAKPSRRDKASKQPKATTDMLTRKDVTSTHLTGILKTRGALTAEALWKASQLEIDDFYEQLKDEEAKGLLRENLGDAPNSPRLLESAA